MMKTGESHVSRLKLLYPVHVLSGKNKNISVSKYFCPINVQAYLTFLRDIIHFLKFKEPKLDAKVYLINVYLINCKKNE